MATPFDRPVLGAVPADARSTGLTYEPFYGLREKPFSLASDARFFYQSRSHAPAFDDLLRAINRREQLTVLSGDIGTGKTTLCRAVLESLDRKTFSAFVPDPFASREDLLKMLLTDFGVAAVEDVTSGRLRGASRTELTYLLHEFLGTLTPLQAFAVVFVDEAQNLSLPLLEELRILSDADGQLQVVLVGQLELRDKLAQPEMRQLDQRVSAHCRLQPLDLAGTAGYISHRLQRAGGSADRLSFSGEAVEAIYERAGGVPRIINRLCDRALQTGYARRVSVIDREMLEGTGTGAAAASRVSVTLPARPPEAPASATALHPSVAPASTTAPPLPARPAPAPAAAARPMPAALKQPVAPPASELIDPVDEWLLSIEDAFVDESERQAMRPRWTPGVSAESHARTRFVPHAHADAPPSRVPRKWTRRLEAVAVGLVILLATILLGPSLWDAVAGLSSVLN